jgi:hypothetical protein
VRKKTDELLKALEWCIENRRSFCLQHQARHNWYNFEYYDETLKKSINTAADNIDNLAVSVDLIKRGEAMRRGEEPDNSAFETKKDERNDEKNDEGIDGDEDLL